jgi:hypothetical protein
MMRKSPQEKKRLSYLKDRRNSYGEHDKGSRTSIRLRKRSVNRANRRWEHLALAEFGGSPSPTGADAIERSLHRRRSKSWSKGSDTPLGTMVVAALRRRVTMGIDDPVRAGDRIRKVQERLDGGTGRQKQ